MSRFEDAIDETLENEGGLSDHPNDPGGLTNFGITQRDFPHLDIRNLTKEQAKQIYRSKYWLPAYDTIASQAVANKVFDSAVNMGHSQAHKNLQRALHHFGKNVDIDGVIGPATISATNGMVPDSLLAEIRAQQCLFYVGLVLSDSNKGVFLKGWLRRACK